MRSSIAPLPVALPRASGQWLPQYPGVTTCPLSTNGPHTTCGSSRWFGLKKTEPLWLELHLHQVDPGRGNKLTIQVVFRPQSISQLSDAAWRERCTRVYVALRSYLMGTDE